MLIKGLPPSTLARLATIRWRRPERQLHVLLCIADHFEPKRDRPSRAVERDRVARWANEYPGLASSISDSRGRPPQHTFFYPVEEYDAEHIEEVAGICRQGFGDVEVHLHHDHDTADGLREKLTEFTAALHESHGLLERGAAGRVTYGFIHGNWALDNSRPDGRWCGVNNELSVLLETGCYADFTMPSAPAPCQTSTINSIYYANDNPAQPKSHDRGTPARAGAPAPEDALLMIQGPLALDWRRRRWGLVPRVENGDLTKLRPPTLDRLWSWLAANIHVAGKDDWRFVKLHTHGALEANAGMLLGEPMRAFHAALKSFAVTNDWFHYYYVTAREMARIIKAVEDNPRLVSPDSVLRAEAMPAGV